MNTFGNIIAAKEREGEARGLELGEARGLELGEARGLELGEARGLELGEARGEKRILVQFVAEFWDDDEAARFAQQLDSAAPDRFPSIADLMRDQAAGRLPRLQQNNRAEPGKQVEQPLARHHRALRHAGNIRRGFPTAGPGLRC